MNINANKILSSIKMQMLLGDEDIKPIMHDSVRNILSATFLSNKWSGVMDGGERGEMQEWDRGNLAGGQGGREGAGRQGEKPQLCAPGWYTVKGGTGRKEEAGQVSRDEIMLGFGHHTESSL